jgi:hypothetical protein
MSIALSIDEAVEEFQEKARPLVTRGDRPALRELFAKYWADIQVWHPRNAYQARKSIERALWEVIREPGTKVKSNGHYY